MLPAPIPLTRRDLFAALLPATVLLVFALGRAYFGVCGQCHDDGIYVATAKALAQGEGYRQINLPDAPAQTKYPILYPAVLAVLWAIGPAFPENLLLLQGLSLVCGAVLTAGAPLYLIRFGYASRRVAFAGAVVCATSSLYAFFATITMAEMFFGTLVLAALWRTELALRAPELRPLTGLGLGALLALPALCRSIGVVFLPAALLLLARRRHAVRWPALGAALVVLPWVAWAGSEWMSSRHDPIRGYYTDYLGWFANLGLPILARVLGSNGMSLLTSIPGLPLEGVAGHIEHRHFGVFLLGFGTLGAVALGQVMRLAAAGRPLAIFLVGYLLVVWVWPWPPYRFLLPVMPLLFVVLLDALSRLPWPKSAEGPRAGAVVLAGALGVVCVAGNVRYWAHVVERRHRLETPNPEMTSATCWRDTRALFAWLDANSQPDDVIACGYDSMVYLYTDRRSIYPIVCPPLELFYQPSAQPVFGDEELVTGLNAYRPRYVVQMPNHHGEARYRAWFAQVQARFPDHVVPVYQGDDARITVHEVRYPLTGASDPSPPVAHQSSGPATIGEFSLPDTAGGTWRLSDARDRKAVVVVFLTPGCPLAELYAPRLAEMGREYRKQGIAFVAIVPTRDDSDAEAARYARRHALGFPVLKDSGHVLADRFGAERSPEAFVLDARGAIRYRGRIDDQYGVGVKKPSPARRELADALSAVLAGRPVAVPVTRAPGCPLPRAARPRQQAAVSYCKDVAPILQRRCQVCHRPGEVGPFALRTYADAVQWSGAMREAIEDRRMPPWGADPRHGTFANDPSLTPAEKETVLRWIDAGCPEGNIKDLPPPPRFPKGWTIPGPDLVLSMPKPFTVPAEGVIEYQYIRVDPGFTEDRWVKAAEVQPGNRAVVHHCNIFLQPPGVESPEDLGVVGQLGSVCLTMVASGTPPMILPAGMAKRIPAGWQIIFVMHYQSVGAVQQDQTRLALTFCDPKEVKQEVATRLMYDPELRIPPNTGHHRVSQTWAVHRDVKLLSFFPHMHLRGKSFRYDLIHPDGREEVLLDVPRYDFAWQHRYVLKDPRLVRAGSRLRCTAIYDNSSANPANPDASAEVRAGPQSWDEMFNGYFDVVLADEDLTRPPPWYAPAWAVVQKICQPGGALLLCLAGGLYLGRRRIARACGERRQE